MAYDYGDLKFLSFSADGKHLMRFQSEKLHFQISPAQCGQDLRVQDGT